MKWETVKGELKLNGATLEVDFDNASLRGVEVTLVSGERFRVAQTGYASIALQVPARPKMVKKWRVTGKTDAGLEIAPAFFATQYEASNATEGLHNGGLVEEVEVEADE